MITNLELDHHSRWGSLAELSEAFAAFASPASALRHRRRGASSRAGGAAGHPLRARAGARRDLAGREGGPPDRRGSDQRRRHRFRARGAGDRRGGRAAASPAATTSPTRWPRSAGWRWRASTSERLRRGPRGLPAASPGASSRRASANGARIYDDYAHHPTEVAATLEAARELGPTPADRRLPAPPLLADQGARQRSSAPPWPPPTRSRCSTSIRRARSRSGPLEGVSGLMVADAAADSAGGRPVWWLPTAEAADRGARAAPRARATC